MMNIKQHKILAGAVAGILMSQIALGSLVVNDKSIINQNWDALSGFQGTGTGGTAPSTSGGLLTLTMDGATGGSTFVRTGVTSVPTDYVITTRVNVKQFADVNFDVSNVNLQGIALTDVRGNDWFRAVVTPTALYIADFQAGGVDWATIPVATATNTFYTWQFQVTEGPGTTAGQVEIYRRQSDGDAWTGLGASEIKQQDFGDDIYMGVIAYNADNTQTQGILEGDYYQFGRELVVPEPSTAVLVVLGMGLMGLRRRTCTLLQG